MGKRTRGYGAVYHQPNRRWDGQIRIPEGRRQSFYARTQRDVIDRLSEARWAVGQGLPVSAGTTSLETWLSARSVEQIHCVLHLASNRRCIGASSVAIRRSL
jgi:hypothetical protein